jgi:hypothetical protein
VNRLNVKALRINEFKPIRDPKTGELIGIKIGIYKNLKLKYLSPEAKDYLFSTYPLELSSLEKELL